MMPEQPKTFRTREVQGMILFTLAVFPLILVVMALIKGQPPSGRGTAAIAAAIIESVGYFPPILCAGGLAGLGVALMLSTREIALPRHVAGFVVTSLGLAVCMEEGVRSRPEAIQGPSGVRELEGSHLLRFQVRIANDPET